MSPSDWTRGFLAALALDTIWFIGVMFIFLAFLMLFR